MRNLLPTNRLNLALLGLATLPSIAQTKPNVIFIMTDQQEYQMLSCMGNKWLSTPNIDKIASMGYRFENNYCANPVSMPSRFSLLTGHYASEVGVKENTSAWDKEKVTEIVSNDALGNIFQRAGYETLYSGKTHLYGTKDVSEYGFKLNTLDPYDGPAIYAEQVFAEKGKTKQEKPFFLFLSFLNPHDICYKAGADKRYPDNLPPANVHETSRLIEYQKTLSAKEYQKQIPPAPNNIESINGELPEMVSMAAQGRNWDKTQWDFYRWMYYRLTESVDHQIGRVLTALEKAGLMDNTIIIFTSDHGEMNESHKLITKNVMFEESQRVPFIFAGKGIKTNFADKKTLTCNGLDFIPTICDLVGIQSPKGLHGVSLKSYLTGQGESPARKFIITEDYNAFQIHDGRYKLTIYELPGNPEMLVDLISNPGETINYANNSSYLGIKSKLKKLLLDDLTGRGLTPLKQDRTVQNIREIEKSKGTRKGERSKLKEDFSE
jgi:arylsulfatase A-like enzyme